MTTLKKKTFDLPKLYDLAKTKWGLASQVIMLAEESAELAVATLHLNRASKDTRKSWKSFVGEVADVEIMLAEMKHYFPELVEQVERTKIKKLERLEKRLRFPWTHPLQVAKDEKQTEVHDSSDDENEAW